jgi:hypothetical protein
VPGLLKSIEEFAQNNVRDFASQHLLEKGFVHYARRDAGDKHTLTARAIAPIRNADLAARGWKIGEGYSYLHVIEPTYIQLDRDDQVVRFLTAKSGLCQFHAQKGRPLEVTVHVQDARDFEIGRRVVALENQQLKFVGPVTTPFRLQTADLATLLAWRQRPWRSDKLAQEIQKFLARLAVQRYYVLAGDQLARGDPLPLVDDEGRHYELRGAAPASGRKGLDIQAIELTVTPAEGRAPTRYRAPQAVLIARPTVKGNLATELRLLRTEAQPVLEFNPRARDGAPIEKPNLPLDGTRPPPELVSALQDFSAEDLMSPDVPLPVQDDRLADERVSLQRTAEQTRRKVTAAIHFRLGFTSSLLTSVVLGAILGVIFRGSRALAAFALALIPLLGSLMLMLLGKTLTENVASARAGPMVTWIGLAAFFLADAAALRFGVRR